MYDSCVKLPSENLTRIEKKFLFLVHENVWILVVVIVSTSKFSGSFCAVDKISHFSSRNHYDRN